MPNTSLSESFTYDKLNRLTSSTVSLTPTPLVATFSYNSIGNLTYKSDVGAYSYPAPGQPRPHGVASISGGAINTSFAYDAKGNMTSGNGLTVAYTSYNKTASITRGTTSISFEHDTEHQAARAHQRRRPRRGPGGRQQGQHPAEHRRHRDRGDESQARRREVGDARRMVAHQARAAPRRMDAREGTRRHQRLVGGRCTAPTRTRTTSTAVRPSSISRNMHHAIR